MSTKRKQPEAEASVPPRRSASRDVRSPVPKKARTASDKGPSVEDETLHSSQNDDDDASESDSSSHLSESSKDEEDTDSIPKAKEDLERAPDPAIIMPDFSASHVQKPFANRLASFISSIASSNEQLELAQAAGEAVNADFEIESQNDEDEDEDEDADESAGNNGNQVDPDGEGSGEEGEQAGAAHDTGGPYIEMDLGLGVLEEQPEPGHFEDAFVGADERYHDEDRNRDDHLLADLTNISRSTSHTERDKRPGIAELP